MHHQKGIQSCIRCYRKCYPKPLFSLKTVMLINSHYRYLLLGKLQVLLPNMFVYWMLTSQYSWGRPGRDHMVVGFTITYAISAYHHWCCEFESWSGRGVQHYVIKFVSDLRQVGGFLQVLRFPPPRYNWNIVESGVKHH